MSSSNMPRLNPDSIPDEHVQQMSEDEFIVLMLNDANELKTREKQRIDEEVAKETRKRFRVFGPKRLSRIEENSKLPEKLLGLDMIISISNIMEAMEGGQGLDEIIRNVTVRPDFDWNDEAELRRKFESDTKDESFGDEKGTALAREIFEKLFTAGKIIHKAAEDKRKTGNSQSDWIGEGSPWETSTHQ